MPAYEEVFLAIAIKNNILDKEKAISILKEYKQEITKGTVNSIEEFVLSKNYLDKAHVDELSHGTKRVLKIEEPEPTPPQKQSPQEVIPGYRIKGKIASGGTATVFIGEDINTGSPVAIKILLPSRAQNPRDLNEFMKEAKLLTEFDHPNIVKGYKYGEANGLYYLILEYLHGNTLQEMIDMQKSIPEDEAIRIILEVAKALDYIQSKGYVHRDVKPGNVMSTTDGKIKLLDLGFCLKMGSLEEDQEFTAGTAEFISPEQAQGAKDIDIRSDIYSLGATFYYMVIGDLPFKGQTNLEIIAQHVLQSLNSAEIKNRNLSRLTHYFIERMMSKDKDLRYDTPKQLIQDITANIEGYQRLVADIDKVKADHKTTVMQLLSGDKSPAPPKITPTSKTTQVKFPTTRFKKLGQATKRIQDNDKPK